MTVSRMLAFTCVAAAFAAVPGCNRVPRRAPPPVEPGRVDAVARAEGSFAMRLLARLSARSPRTNLLIGPDSLHSAMALVASGAAGDTRAQVLAALELDPALDPPVEAVAALQHALARHDDADGLELAIVHRLWIERSFAIEPAWRARVDAAFDAPFESLDFARDPEDARDTINAFIENATRDRIAELMPTGSIDALTRLVVTNATWFKGRWKWEFDPDQTRPGPFTRQDGSSIDAPFMHRKHDFAYAAFDGGAAIELPYVGDALSMVIVLPDDVAAISNWSGDDLDRVVAQLRAQQVDVFVPRFTFRGSYALVDVFRDLGVTLAFDADHADFAPLSARRGLHVTGIFHKTFIDVNEEGTEAAAASGVALAVKSAVARTPTFRADRPFLFAIRERAHGALLFAGIVHDPTKS